MRSLIMIVCLIWCLMIASGCTLMDAGQDIARYTKQAFRPTTSDYRDTTEETGHDEWDFVSSEGRGDQERQRDPDRWWQDFVMSNKARHIERNLGID